ncbi:MAG TPA: GNAT family N-acetyltransferase [Candidatus Baltobacteraceae bacterium]|nr:GNAT family N-acetyltransferase [Candidatus Baltobacteraceae bacterium]
MQSPIIQTPRLVLRPHRLSDFDAMAAMWREPQIVRYISGKPSTREQSWMRLLRYVGHWSLLDYGYWVIEDRQTGEFAGECGFADFHRDIDPPLDGMPEMGWMIAPRFQGKGYATEGIVACLTWGARHFPAGTTFACIITPDNLASVRVAEKCGFRLREETTYLGDAVGLYTRDAV